jgi:hypothetical protein
LIQSIERGAEEMRKAALSTSIRLDTRKMSHETSGGDHSGETMSTFFGSPYTYNHAPRKISKSANWKLGDGSHLHIYHKLYFKCFLSLHFIDWRISNQLRGPSAVSPSWMSRTGHCVRFRGGVAIRGFAFCFKRLSYHQPTPRVETQTFPDGGPWKWWLFTAMRIQSCAVLFPSKHTEETRRVPILGSPNL